MDIENLSNKVCGAGEGYSSTGAAVGSEVGPTASTTRDHGRSRVDRQAPGRVSTPGDGTGDRRRTTGGQPEDNRRTTGGQPEDNRMETAEESPRRVTRRSLRAADRPEGVFLTPARLDDGTSPMAGGSRARARSDDEDPTASITSRSASAESRGKKRRITATTPEVSEELEAEMRTSSPADISAGLTMQVSEIMHVATTSSKLKGTYIRSLKNAASYITAVWNTESSRRTRPARDTDDVDTRLSVLEKENAALRQELRRLAARVHECPRCANATPEYDRPPREDGNDRTRLDALERVVRELGSSILRTIEEPFGDTRWQHPPEARPSKDHSVDPRAAQPTSPPREQEDGGWELAETKKKRRRRRKANGTRTTVAAEGEAARRGPTAPPPTRARQQQPQPGRTAGAPKQSAPATQKGPLKTPKAMTGAIIIKVPGDKDRGKATLLATRLAEALDPTPVRIATPTRMAELRVTGIDISVKREELQEALASAAGCGSAEVQVGEIGATRGGLGTAWIKCPAAGARAWNWDTYAPPAYPAKTEGTYATGAAETDTAPETVPPPLPSAPCASRSGRPRTTGWAERHAPHRKSRESDRSANQQQQQQQQREGTPGSAAEPTAADGREEAMETIRENEVALAAVAEPHRIPDSPNWVGDLDGSAGITWTAGPGVLLDSGSGFVAVEWQGAAVVAVYVSPNIDLAAYGDFLDRGLGEHLRGAERILGSGHHVGHPGATQTNPRLEGGRGGGSAIRSPLHTDGGGPGGRRRRRRTTTTGRKPPPPATAMAFQGKGQGDATGGHDRIRLELGRPTDNRAGKHRRGGGGAPKIHVRGVRHLDAALSPGGGGRRDQGTYWWTPEIAEMRENCVRARRRFLRARRRRLTRDEEQISSCYEEYREARRTLQREIKTAKARCWTELIEEVESDPWGRPYKVVTKKLRPSAPPLTSNMDPALLDNVIGTLFPLEDTDTSQPAPSSPSVDDDDDDDEEAATTRRQRRRPQQDGAKNCE
ncbi:uncharacterized protein LOC117240471 [Bombus vosnesenskii]|uniref:Uncharacterized protein LOC117240471 n=1 Tax=Bombus vosnesenskii TaxID=207650 RepID=A0A6J3LB37_9HYME|nr:uncharacterized protein LOC117240471 [Bombus vosnesenskii]